MEFIKGINDQSIAAITKYEQKLNEIRGTSNFDQLREQLEATLKEELANIARIYEQDFHSHQK